jgi:putative FmdB family regulatory protein
MPIYEYQCLKCAHVFEYIVFRDEEEETLRCPQCSGEVKRVMSAPQEPIFL